MQDVPRSAPATARCLAIVASLGLASAMLGLAFGVEAVSTWFYDLTWWSYIVLVDAVIHLREGRSLLISKPRTFALLAVWSAFFWLCFEMANLRLENWYYVGIPPDWFSRGPGVFVSFATVLPGVLETAELAASLRLAERLARRPRALSRSALRWIAALGWITLAAPLVWPRYAYPLIWAPPVFLGEPFLAARGERGLLGAAANGDPRGIVRVLAAGAVCGLLWETWNHGASAKWIYTVPFFDEHKLFEMPFLGFVGFLPFALGCHTFARVLVALGWLSEWELSRPDGRTHAGRDALLPAAAAFLACVPMIGAVNASTLHATLPRVSEIPGVEPEFAASAERAGLGFVRTWLAATRLDPERWRETDPLDLARWIESAELMQVRGLGGRGADWLARAGVRTRRELAAREPEALHAELLRGAGPTPPPSLAEVRVWVRGARASTAP